MSSANLLGALLGSGKDGVIDKVVMISPQGLVE